MIKPEDAEFHFTPESHWQWAETIALPFHVPEARLNGIIYVLARPKIGACMCDISLHDRLSDLWEEQLYIDNQQHLPCPKSLLDIDLPNGLKLKAVDPVKRYHASYAGIDDTRFELRFEALHEPYDINDPEMDPTAAKRNGPAWDSSWSGHFEVTYRVTGDLVVRGRHHKIDCVDTGDRSWGPRVERDNSSVIWWHASFGEDLTVHLFTGHDLAHRNEVGPHVSGYVMERGKTYGLTASSGTQEYRGAVPIGGQLSVTDVRSKTFDLTYSALNSSFWAPYPSNTYLQTYMRVNHAGRIGYGVQQLGLSRAYLTRHRDAIRTR